MTKFPLKAFSSFFHIRRELGLGPKICNTKCIDPNMKKRINIVEKSLGNNNIILSMLQLKIFNILSLELASKIILPFLKNNST